MAAIPVNLWDPTGKFEEGDEDLPQWAQDEIWRLTDIYNNAETNNDKARARKAAVNIRQMYKPDYVDDFDYTFGTNASFLVYPQSVGVFNYDYTTTDVGGAVTVTSVITVEKTYVDGRFYIRLLNVSGTASVNSGFNVNGIYIEFGVVGLNNGGAVTKMEDQITGSYTYSYSFDGPAVLDDQGDGTGMTTVVANVYVYIQRPASPIEYCIQLTHNIYWHYKKVSTQQKDD